MKFLPNVPPQIFTISAVVVGYLLVDDATPNEQNALGNWLMLVSQYLCTSAAYGQLLQSRSQTPGSFSENTNKSTNLSDKETMDMLVKMVNALNKEIDEIKKNL